MRDKGGLRAFAKWACIISAVVIACAWLGTRFAAVDIQTGTPLTITLDQGMAIFVTGDAPVDMDVEIVGHDPDQVTWQWWFASYPNSVLVPLWVPLFMLGALGGLLSGPAWAEAPRDEDAVRLIEAVGRTPP